MNKIILILASVFVMSHQVYANDIENDTASIQAYVSFFKPTRLSGGNQTMLIQNTNPVNSAQGAATGSYSIIANNQQITVTATTKVNQQKTVTCTMTPDMFPLPITFNSFLTMVKTFTQPKKKIFVNYSNGICVDFSVQ